MKLLVSNYAAEYGGCTGGQLTFTFTGGTPQLHGSAFYYRRHEMFNANEWFNNNQGIAERRSRPQTRIRLDAASVRKMRYNWYSRSKT